MRKIVFKDVTNIMYSGEVKSEDNNIITINDLKVESNVSSLNYGVVNLKQKGFEYKGETKVNLNNVIWFSFQEV